MAIRTLGVIETAKDTMKKENRVDPGQSLVEHQCPSVQVRCEEDHRGGLEEWPEGSEKCQESIISEKPRKDYF